MLQENEASERTLSPAQQDVQRLFQFVAAQVIGQDTLIERMLIALLADGHMLVEGAPGLAKTRAINVLSRAIEGDFHRIQFTPDLLPADLTGTEIYRPQDGSFHFQPGPLFHNLVLADEINRSPAKVQSSLLEAMAERQITVGRVTYKLPDLFMVMATQNPVEQEGTYPLPEAQLDRFMLYIRIGYPDAQYERAILRLVREEARRGRVSVEKAFESVSQETLFKARQEVLDLYMADNLEEYLLQLVLSTRNPGAYGKELGRWLQYGASPRATIALDRCARARAWLHGRDYVTPEDIQSIAPDVLRHRLILSYEAEAEGVSSDRVIQELLRRVAVP
ncbi:AAA family ATPase [Methylocaldum szegediense]|uniref:MoxR-like ATPase n=1 Tax=Methylocaldum szegediense TaxID=73780 RepID=A0ABN8X847_9GAMM|nr:MoxR family ATPase [Methylocaldum szegediense]CAI8851547.1 MoxR-like ATPase [Methylocaldum szegediense]